MHGDSSKLQVHQPKNLITLTAKVENLSTTTKTQKTDEEMRG